MISLVYGYPDPDIESVRSRIRNGEQVAVEDLARFSYAKVEVGFTEKAKAAIKENPISSKLSYQVVAALAQASTGEYVAWPCTEKTFAKALRFRVASKMRMLTDGGELVMVLDGGDRMGERFDS